MIMFWIEEVVRLIEAIDITDFILDLFFFSVRYVADVFIVSNTWTWGVLPYTYSWISDRTTSS